MKILKTITHLNPQQSLLAYLILWSVGSALLFRSLITSILFVFCSGVFFIFNQRKKIPVFRKANFLTFALSFGYSSFLIRQIIEIKNSSKLQVLSDTLGFSSTLFVLAIVFFSGIFSFYLFLYLFNLLNAKIPEITFPSENSTINNSPDSKKIPLLISVISSFVIIGICSKSSPLYPLNDWVDANCFFTVGKAMWSGVIPYKDLLEQKGPLLYIAYALAALVSARTFLGGYLLEVIAVSFFLHISYKTATLFFRNFNPVWIPVWAVFICTANSFAHGGSAEELCLPFIAYGIYSGLKAVKNNTIPSNLELLTVGVTAACVFWIKYTMTGFYAGWFAAFVVILLKNKAYFWNLLLKMTGFICLGVLLVSVPIIFYFVVNNAAADLFRVYFYENIFHYSSIGTSKGSLPVRFIANLLYGGRTLLGEHWILFFSMLYAVVICYRSKKYETALFLLTAFAGAFTFIFIGGVHLWYYVLILYAFIPAGLSFFAVFSGIDQKIKIPNILLIPPVIAVCAVSAYCFSQNTYLMRYKKQDLPQYKFAGIINKNASATLLNYRFLDGGFYTVAGIIPDCKSFCRLNINKAEWRNIQDEYVEKGLADFIVCSGELENENYICLSTESLEHREMNHIFQRTYRLYQRKTKTSGNSQ